MLQSSIIILVIKSWEGGLLKHNAFRSTVVVRCIAAAAVRAPFRYLKTARLSTHSTAPIGTYLGPA